MDAVGRCESRRYASHHFNASHRMLLGCLSLALSLSSSFPLDRAQHSLSIFRLDRSPTYLQFWHRQRGSKGPAGRLRERSADSRTSQHQSAAPSPLRVWLCCCRFRLCVPFKCAFVRACAHGVRLLIPKPPTRVQGRALDLTWLNGWLG